MRCCERTAQFWARKSAVHDGENDPRASGPGPNNNSIGAGDVDSVEKV
jgi:hypothetical protein